VLELGKALLLLGAVALSACTVKVDYGGVGFSCSAEEACQAGLSCVDQICQVDPNQPDATPGDGDAEPVACLPVITLSDDFTGDSLDPQWVENAAAGTSVDIGGGVLTLTPTTANPARFARIRSVEAFNMDGKRVFLELPSMVNTSTLAIAEFRWRLSGQDSYVMRQSMGVMQFGSKTGGNEVIVSASQYSPVAHRWWQMRMVGGRVYGDVSANGVDWTNLDSVPADVVGQLEIDIRAGTRDNVAEPGALQVDNLNVGNGLCP